MAAGGMLRITQGFSFLNVHTTSWTASGRRVSNKNLFEKLGLPEKPKKPASPFITFRQSVKPDLMRENPKASVIDISKLASQLWKKQSDRRKEELSEAFKRDYKKFKEELKRYEKSLTSEQKSELKEAERELKSYEENRILKTQKAKREKVLEKPRYPTTPFLRFVNDQRKSSRDKDSKTFLKNMGSLWKASPKEVCEKYKAEFQRELEQYNLALDKWEQEMIKQGNFDLVRQKTLKLSLKA